MLNLNFNQTPRQALAPIKKAIEDKIGPVEKFSLEIDFNNSTMTISAGNKQQVEKSKMLITAIKFALKKYVGRNDMKQCTIEYGKEKIRCASLTSEGWNITEME